MWHCRMMVIAAALAMAACDTSSGPDEQTGPTTDTSSDTGKGDDPYQPDTNNTTPDDTFTPPLTVEDLCGDLLDIVGIWWCESDNHLIDGSQLMITVQIATTSDQCELTFACDGCGTWRFVGKTLPLQTQYTSGIHDWIANLFIKSEALVLEEVRSDRPDAPMWTEFYR